MERSRAILSRVIKEKKAQMDNGHGKFEIEFEGKRTAVFSDYIDNSNEVPLLDLIMRYRREVMTDEQIYQETVLFTSAVRPPLTNLSISQRVSFPGNRDHILRALLGVCSAGDASRGPSNFPRFFKPIS